MSNIEKKKSTVVEIVTDRVQQLQELGQLHLPKDYSASNAVRAAWLVLEDQTNRDGDPVLEIATRRSVIDAMFKMVISGLSVVKKQGDFILYKDKLSFQPEYHGKKLLCKRFCDVAEVNHLCVYEGDEFEFIVDKKGRKQIQKHIPKAENIDINKIRYAYAVVVFNDGSTQAEVMTIQQIKQAWLQGPMKGQSGAHKNFTDAMAEKSVANRIMTRLINASDDAAIVVMENENAREELAQESGEPARTKARKTISFEEAEVMDDDDEPVKKAEKKEVTDFPKEEKPTEAPEPTPEPKKKETKAETPTKKKEAPKKADTLFDDVESGEPF